MTKSSYTVLLQTLEQTIPWGIIYMLRRKHIDCRFSIGLEASSTKYGSPANLLRWEDSWWCSKSRKNSWFYIHFDNI
jgi:hypothetical protein